MTILRLLLVLVGLVGYGTVSVLPAAVSRQPESTELQWALRAGQGEWEVTRGGRRLLVYVFASHQFKPYVRELYTLGGRNVLRDAPADHLHHHGLMYAIRINGVNFWEEHGAPGVQKPIRFLSHRQGRDARGRARAAFTQLIHWVEGADRARDDTASVAFLTEERTLTLTVDEAREEVALTWEASFQAGPKGGGIILRGTDYNGLGLRLPEALDHVARFQNAAGISYSAAQQRDVMAADWSSVSGPLRGGKVMVALFGHPSNAGGGPRFFSMRNPFAYLSVTQGLDKKPLEYRAGERFQLKYLLTVYDEARTETFLDKRRKIWLEKEVKRGE